MRDVEFPPDADSPDLNPADPEQQELYVRSFRGRYAKETAELDPNLLGKSILEQLERCPQLRIRSPRDVLRFLELEILVMPRYAGSQLLETVVRRVLNAVEDWSATKRLDFIYKHVVGRAAPTSEPDFGPWYTEVPSPV